MTWSRKPIELTGHRYGAMTVVERSTPLRTVSQWLCQCDCGSFRVVQGVNLGKTRSCGCKRGESIALANTSHGQSRTRLYRMWMGMRRRCENRKDKNWKYYGGRGIKVCDRWQNFDAFRSDMGDAPAPWTLERIDNDGDYEPGNVCWATRAHQNKTKRHRA